MRLSTDWFKSIDLCNRLGWILVVGIDALEGYPSLSLTVWWVVDLTEWWPSKEIRALNHLRDLRDSSRYAAGWKQLLPRGGTLGLDPECLRETVWLGVISVEYLQRGSDRDFGLGSRELVYDLASEHISWSWQGSNFDHYICPFASALVGVCRGEMWANLLKGFFCHHL